MLVLLAKKLCIKANADLRDDYAMKRASSYEVIAFDSEDDTILVVNDDGRIVRLDYEEFTVEYE